MDIESDKFSLLVNSTQAEALLPTDLGPARAGIAWIILEYPISDDIAQRKTYLAKFNAVYASIYAVTEWTVDIMTHYYNDGKSNQGDGLFKPGKASGEYGDVHLPDAGAGIILM